MKTYKYYQVTAHIDGRRERLFGSYAKQDCIWEIDAEKASWKNEGYQAIHLSTTTTATAPDMADYEQSVADFNGG